MKNKNYWVYILHCEGNTYYTGYTVDIAARYQAHLMGKCKYTRSFKPLGVAQCWRVSDQSLALQVEAYIKKLSRLKKEVLIKQPTLLCHAFDEIIIIEKNLSI
jgi:putative endonuclease